MDSLISRELAEVLVAGVLITILLLKLTVLINIIVAILSCNTITTISTTTREQLWLSG